jgi:hypothetical protein
MGDSVGREGDRSAPRRCRKGRGTATGWRLGGAGKGGRETGRRCRHAAADERGRATGRWRRQGNGGEGRGSGPAALGRRGMGHGLTARPAARTPGEAVRDSEILDREL